MILAIKYSETGRLSIYFNVKGPEPGMALFIVKAEVVVSKLRPISKG
jgi:hypothetical protein